MREKYSCEREITSKCVTHAQCVRLESSEYSHFRLLIIKTYLNIALEGRLSIFHILFTLQKCLIKERNTVGFSI